MRWNVLDTRTIEQLDFGSIRIRAIIWLCWRSLGDEVRRGKKRPRSIFSVAASFKSVVVGVNRGIID